MLPVQDVGGDIAKNGIVHADADCTTGIKSHVTAVYDTIVGTEAKA